MRVVYTWVEPMCVSLRALDIRDPHLDTASIVAWVIQEGLVSLSLDSASACISSDLTKNKRSRVPYHHSLLKILRRILSWVTTLGVAESFFTLAIPAVLSPTMMVELQPNLSTRLVVYPMP